MDGYHIALFVHVFALLAATAASALTHFAESRLGRAESVAAAQQWHRFAGSVSRVFPVAVIALVATGGYMVGGFSAWAWNAGWIEAGVVGSVWLLVSGPTIGIRSKGFGRRLQHAAAAGDGAARRFAPDPVISVLSWANTGVAVGVVFAMVTKPMLAPALTALAIGAAVGAAIALRGVRRAARQVADAEPATTLMAGAPEA